jgi:CDGSH-type Zn-finger protein
MKQTDSFVQIGTTQSDPSVWVEVSENGPYVVHGATTLTVEVIVPDTEGKSSKYEAGRAFPIKEGSRLCRCGQSRNKPYCDNSHLRADVDLRESAPFTPLLEGATEIDGPRLSLTDNERYCAFARFCDNGQRIWNEVQMQGQAHEQLATQMAHLCPSGRLMIWDRVSGTPIEHAVPASLGLIEDPGGGCSGPLVLRGGIRVESANGRSYEIRNRQTLCRCGASSNKPFCDGSHASIKFRDGIES